MKKHLMTSAFLAAALASGSALAMDNMKVQIDSNDHKNINNNSSTNINDSNNHHYNDS